LAILQDHEIRALQENLGREQKRVDALTKELERTRLKMTRMVHVTSVEGLFPRRARYILATNDGRLVGRRERLVPLGEMANELLSVRDRTTITIYRAVPWRTVEVSGVHPEYGKVVRANRLKGGPGDGEEGETSPGQEYSEEE
jgi:hypothetical protein